MGFSIFSMRSSHRGQLARLRYLLGANSGAKVCRYERFNREPSFHAALAYEAIFGQPGSELFGERYQKIQRDVAKRAAKLIRKLEGRKSDRRTARKRAALLAIAKAMKFQ
jgi:inosine/xanthosine triphosphate pyrophosphatase family protein